MKNMKKALVLTLAGVMAVAALALTGCFGIGGGSSSGGSSSGGSSSGGSSTSNSPIVGTWKLDYAHDYSGTAYDIQSIGSDSVVLVVSSETKATFYYFDDDPFEGTLSRDTSMDSYYSATDYPAQCYDLTSSDGDYWEFAFIQPADGSSPFFYLEVGSSNDYDSLYLAK